MNAHKDTQALIHNTNRCYIQGQLGVKGMSGMSLKDRYAPTLVTALHSKKVSDVACGHEHAFALVQVIHTTSLPLSLTLSVCLSISLSLSLSLSLPLLVCRLYYYLSLSLFALSLSLSLSLAHSLTHTHVYTPAEVNKNTNTLMQFLWLT
jgi:hypothetical protein